MKKSIYAIPIIIGIVGAINCGSKKDNTISSSLIIGALQQDRSLDRSVEEEKIPTIPEITLPAPIQSVSPANGATFLLEWQDIGLKQFNPSCNLEQGDTTTNAHTQIRRIRPNSTIVLELQFNEDVDGGNIQLFRKGVAVPGNFTRPSARSARFESNQTGFSSYKFPYSGVATEFVRTASGTPIDAVTWQFYTDFNGEMQKKKELIVENCITDENGNNQCSVEIKQRLNDDFQSTVESQQLSTFYTDIIYSNLGGLIFGYAILNCPTNPIDRKEFTNEYWRLETKARFLNLPVALNQTMADSLTAADAVDGGFFIQYTLVYPGE